MRNYNKLRRFCQPPDVFCEPLNVHVVKRGLDLVEHAERRRPELEYRKVQRDGDERLFAAREQRQRFHRLARRADADVDAAAQHVRRIRQRQLGAAAAEYLAEGLAEIGVELGEFGRKYLLHAHRQLLDDLVQLALGGLEIVLLLSHEREALERLAVLLDRVEVDVAERAHFRPQALRLFLRRRGVLDRVGDLRGGCGRQLIAFPHFIEDLRFLVFQLALAAFQPRRFALEVQYLLVFALRVPIDAGALALDALALCGLRRDLLL